MKGFWDERYAEEGLAYGEEPNVFLTQVVDLINPEGKILVVGDGEGRNGVWLASEGFDVTSVDYSEVAVKKINELAKEHEVNINTICADLNNWDWPREVFDAVVTIYLHFPSESRAAMHGKMLDALKPGGKIIMEAFNKAQLDYPSGGPPVLDMLFSEEELKQDFSKLNIKEAYEKIVYLNEGKYHVGDGAVVRLIGEKKLPE